MLFPIAIWKVKHGMVGRFRAFGRSMEPVIPSGSRVTVEPAVVDELELGDIVAVRVGDSTMLHLVKAIDPDGRQIEISGTSGPPNGWTTLDRVYGICTHNRQGRSTRSRGQDEVA
jgi:Peptidase S24-like